MVVRFEAQYRKNNDLKYKGFQWIFDFLQHFYETFKFLCKVTKNKLIELMDKIEKHYKEIESEIDSMVTNAKDGAGPYDGEPAPNHFKIEKYFQRDGVCVENIHEKNWSDLRKTIEIKMDQILRKIEDQHKRKDWYLRLEQITNVYKKTMAPGWFEGKYFLSGKTYII